MNRKILFSILLLGYIAMAGAQNLSKPMERAAQACTNLSIAIGTNSTSQLRTANEELKSADIVNFGDLWLDKGKDISVDGHFIFDEEFVDSLIMNRKVINFSSRYAKKRSTRGSTGVNGRIKMTTLALKAGQSATWKTVNRRIAEYVVVAEPGGLFTMTIRDAAGKVLYAETVNNKKGESLRKARIELPDKATKIFIEIKNTGKENASFALLGN